MTHVLHVLGGLARGGAETWVLELVNRASSDIDHSVVIFRGGNQDLLDDFVLGGARVVTLPPANTLVGLVTFLRDLRHHKYDTVHCHVQHASWMYLTAAAFGGVRRRLFTAHLDSRAEYAAAGRVRRLYMRASSKCIARFATDVHGVSDAAGSSVLGLQWNDDPKSRVVHCGVDVERFSPRPATAELLDELGLSSREVVFLNVGRFVAQKNHVFLLHWFAHMRERLPDSVLLIVGTGPLETQLKALAASLRIECNVRFLGPRTDVAELMNVASAVILPSIREGLPLVALEAQASGKPVVMSDAVTFEAVVMEEFTRRIGLQRSMNEWVDETRAVIRSVTPALQAECAAAVAASDFNIAVSLKQVEGTYRS